jgi:hypothetical protein
MDELVLVAMGRTAVDETDIQRENQRLARYPLESMPPLTEGERYRRM